MEINNVCPQCDSLLVEERSGCAVTYTCPKCGWSVATTEFEPIDLDDTLYEIYLLDGGTTTKERLSLLSKITGRNFIECKRLIENGGFIFSGRNAREIIEKKAKLVSAGLNCLIKPDFPY